MKVKYKSENGKIEANLSEYSDWELFNRIADLIAKEFKGNWIEKADGIDQRYWDIEIENVVLTLHLEHYSGISLFPAKANDVNAKFLIQRIGNYLEANMPQICLENDPF